jgi:Cof subfamily protein (haloacid dehalogenase superfamily)
MFQFKIIMMDVDGTLSNYSSTNMPLMPTVAVRNAIKKTQGKILIGVATSRPLSKMKPIFEEIKFDCPCILHNGAQIIDPHNLETLWMKPLAHSALKPLYEIANKYGIHAYFSNFESNVNLESYDQLLSNSVADVFYDGVDVEVSNSVLSELSKLSEIFVHRLSSRWKGKYEFSITDKVATKENAIMEVAKLLKISSLEIVGVGDAHNDIPLLSACGYKVAMGNAVDEVKAIADLVVPSVEEDGIKFVLEKFTPDN